MTKRFVLFFAASVLSSVVFAQHCQMPTFVPLDPNTQVALGPAVYNAVMANPAIGTAIVNARDAWDSTLARDRIGDWNGMITASDCPAGQPFQIGAFPFAGSSCPTLVSLGTTNPANVLAFVDYSSYGCYQCGTKSVSVNLNYAWSLDPLPGQYDLQSVLAHEFGHVLGLGHMQNGVCSDDGYSPSCAVSPARETMGRSVAHGETCMRDLSPNDISSANWLYNY